MQSSNSVWITGLGLATPLGCDYHEVADNLFAGRSGIRTIQAFNTSDHVCKIGGFVSSLPLPAGWSAEDFKRLPDWEQLLLSCAARALQDSGWWERRDQVRLGIVLGIGSEWMVTWERDMHQGGSRVLQSQADGEGYARFLQEKLAIRGPLTTVAAACASGNIALGVARAWIRRGWCDVVLAGAGERSLTPMGLGCFGNLGALSRRNDSPAAASRPFDRQRDGFVMAEGGALFVLESESSARRRGAKVYGSVAGFAIQNDAFHLVAPSDDPRHAARAVENALQDAGLNPDQVDYVNAHATSTPVGDTFEARVLQQALGAPAAKIPVSGTKSMTGHMIGATSAVEAAFCLMSFDRQAVPPTINLDDPDPDCLLCHVPNQAQSRRVHTALSNAFGFGGSNTALVLQRVA